MTALQRLGLAVALVLAAVAIASAQPPAGKVYRIGLLETTSLTQNAANVEALKQGLRELGYVEGRSFAIDYRSADGRSERFPELAADLVRLKVDVIMTRRTPAALAAKKATATIPIVIAGIGDPVGPGVVQGLARPGGNVTGLSGMVAELNGKRLELLKEAVPGIVRIAFVVNTSNPGFVSSRKAIEAGAQSLRLELLVVDVRRPEDFGPAFDAAVRQRADAVAVGLDALTIANFRRIAELAAKHRLPSVYPAREFVDAGGLMAYGARSSTFELVINLKAARVIQ